MEIAAALAAKNCVGDGTEDALTVAKAFENWDDVASDACSVADCEAAAVELAVEAYA